LGVWDRNGPSSGRSLGRGGEKNELSARNDAFPCGEKRGFHVIDGSEGYRVEQAGAGKGFSAGGPDFDVRKIQSADGFPEEGGLFVLGLG